MACLLISYQHSLSPSWSSRHGHFVCGQGEARAGHESVAFFDDLESQAAKNVVGLPGSLAFPEFFRPQYLTGQVLAGQTDYGLGRVPPAAVEQLVAGRRAEGAGGAFIQISEGRQHVLLC